MKTEKEFGNLSEFAKRDVELFRSSDQNKTAIYFTDVEDEERKTAKAFFELLRFELGGGDHEIYIRFPNTDYFVEMVGGGMSSAHGDMVIGKGQNLHNTNSLETEFNIYSQGSDLLLSFGDFTRFNFTKKVAEYYKGNGYGYLYPAEKSVNYKEIEKALSMKYLKIPESIRKISYCCKTKDIIPKYFLVDYPAYNFKYDNNRFFVIENEIAKEFKIKEFTRYRDGGTTVITLSDENGVEHVFHSPALLSKETLSVKWDEEELIIATELEKENLAKLLELDLV